ncbi:MFS transporter [Bacillus sp. 03113]|uniref:MFS transporter n=1 Tax=Bacillus sp. 03113 TaxID=2578211 RepID=UPI002852E9C8|nr:MFS transporter [Bacillus sp. 03113]
MIVKQSIEYKWIIFFTVLIAYTLIVVQRTAPGVITDQLMKEYGISASMLGLLTGIQFLAYAGLQIPVGMLADKYGPIYLLITGILLNGLGTVLYSIAPSEHVILFTRLLVGSGDSMILINIVLILSKYFTADKFAGLLGVMGMFGNIGSIMASVPLTIWISYIGWRIPFFTLGISLCAVAILVYIVLMKGSNQSKGLFTTSNQQPRQQKKPITIIKSICSNRQSWAAFLCHFGLVGTYVGFIGSWAIPYGMSVYNMTRIEASQLILLGLIGALIGSPLTGFISDFLKLRKLPYILIHSITFLCWGTFIVLDGKPPLPILIALYIIIGYGNGSSVLTFAIVRQTFPNTEVGVVTGFANTGGFVSAVLLPLLFGFVLEHNLGYQYSFWIPAMFSVLGLIGSFIINEKLPSSKPLHSSAPA